MINGQRIARVFPRRTAQTPDGRAEIRNGKKIHWPVLIYNDVYCCTACGWYWLRPKKKIRGWEVTCKRCRRSWVFRKYAKGGD
jgi:hypothetical protein